MTHMQRMRDIQALGYTEREADFLCQAALHSGYFVRRQYLEFSGCERGRADTALIEKASAAGHVKELRFRFNRTVYSFCSKPFFRALGDTDNRNRRTHEIQTIKTRLVGLDFVLCHDGIEYLTTEAEKARFFGERFGVGLDALPAKRYDAMDGDGSTDRYFVDKFPIGFANSQDTPGLVVFTFIDPGDHSMSRFRAFLNRYRPLFKALPRFRLIYVTLNDTNTRRAQNIFDHEVASHRRPSIDPELVRLLQHFQERAAYERKDMSQFDQKRLIRFREDRRVFSRPEHDALFAGWVSGGDKEVLRRQYSDCDQNAVSDCEFSAWVSSFRYELFGTIIGGKSRGTVDRDGTASHKPSSSEDSGVRSAPCARKALPVTETAPNIRATERGSGPL
jgi:hypothetical protein